MFAMLCLTLFTVSATLLQLELPSCFNVNLSKASCALDVKSFVDVEILALSKAPFNASRIFLADTSTPSAVLLSMLSTLSITPVKALASAPVSEISFLVIAIFY